MSASSCAGTERESAVSAAQHRRHDHDGQHGDEHAHGEGAAGAGVHADQPVARTRAEAPTASTPRATRETCVDEGVPPGNSTVMA